MRFSHIWGVWVLMFLLSGCGSIASSPYRPTAAVANTPPSPCICVPPTPTLESSGWLVVRSEPPGAMLRIDCRQRGQTPWKGELSTGWHELEITLPGYERWVTETEIVSKSVVTVQANLQFHFQVTLLPLQQGGSRWLTFVEWDADGKGLRYALGDSLDEPKDWEWYRYDLITDQEERLLPPQSQVSDQVRAKLGLCPLDKKLSSWQCRLATVLAEAPSGIHMVYAPPHMLETPGMPSLCEFNLWHADVLGQNQVYLGRVIMDGECGAKPSVIWSPKEDWVLINASYDGGIFYLAKVDGTFFERFPLSRQVRTYLEIPPQFSPDGEKIAFVGTMYEQKMIHNTWLARVSSGAREVTKISDHIGLLQWASDSRRLYIFDIANTHAVYRVDLSEALPQEKVIVGGLPFPTIVETNYEWGLGQPDMYHWALSPDENRIGYCGVDGKHYMWGILQFAPER